MGRSFSRRSAFAIPLLVPYLGGCAALTGDGSTLPATLADLPNAVGVIAADLQAYLSTLPANLSAGASSIVAKISSIAAQLSAAVAAGTPSVVSTLVSSVGSAVSSLLGLVGGNSALGGLGTFGSILSSVLTFLPTLLSIAGLALAGPVDPRAAAAAWAYLVSVHG